MMYSWKRKKEIVGDDPPYLPVGTEVSARYKGAFCEAKIKKLIKCIKCKVQCKGDSELITLSDEHIKGVLMVGATVEVRKSEKKDFVEGTIMKIQDISQYTVMFDDGDIATLRRPALCLKSGRYFADCATLDHLPLTCPERLTSSSASTNVSSTRSRAKRRRNDDSSDEDLSTNKRAADEKHKVEKEKDMGNVVCVELSDKRKSKENWFPALIVAPNAQETVKIDVQDEYLVRSFKDGRYYTVPKNETTQFTKLVGGKAENPTLKVAVQKAVSYLENDELPPHWDRDVLFGMVEYDCLSSDDSDSDTSKDEPREEKDRFVAQLYKFMDDSDTPINKALTIESKDVDLCRLYKIVIKLGGYNRVTNRNLWKFVSLKLGFGPDHTKSVKSLYKQYLHTFEDFDRKLGCTMMSSSKRSSVVARNHQSRPLIRDRDRSLFARAFRRTTGAAVRESSVSSFRSCSSPGGVPDAGGSPSISPAPSTSSSNCLGEENKPEKESDKDNSTAEKLKCISLERPITRSDPYGVPPVLKDETKWDGISARDNKVGVCGSQLKCKDNLAAGKIEKKCRTEKESKMIVVGDGQRSSGRINRRKIARTFESAFTRRVRKRKLENASDDEEGKCAVKLKRLNRLMSLKSSSNIVRDNEKEPAALMMEELATVDNVSSVSCDNISNKNGGQSKTNFPQLVDTKKLLNLPVDVKRSKSLKEHVKSLVRKIRIGRKRIMLSEAGPSQQNPPSLIIDENDSKAIVSNEKEKISDDLIDTAQFDCSFGKDEFSTKKKMYLSSKKYNEDCSISKQSSSSKHQANISICPSRIIRSGDRLKVYYGPKSKVLYEAKVMDMRMKNGVKEYLVHYTGWNTRYDEWINRNRIADNLSRTSTTGRKKPLLSQDNKVHPAPTVEGDPVLQANEKDSNADVNESAAADEKIDIGDSQSNDPRSTRSSSTSNNINKRDTNKNTTARDRDVSFIGPRRMSSATDISENSILSSDGLIESKIKPDMEKIAPSSGGEESQANSKRRDGQRLKQKSDGNISSGNVRNTSSNSTRVSALRRKFVNLRRTRSMALLRIHNHDGITDSLKKRKILRQKKDFQMTTGSAKIHSERKQVPSTDPGVSPESGTTVVRKSVQERSIDRHGQISDIVLRQIPREGKVDIIVSYGDKKLIRPATFRANKKRFDNDKEGLEMKTERFDSDNLKMSDDKTPPVMDAGVSGVNLAQIIGETVKNIVKREKVDESLRVTGQSYLADNKPRIVRAKLKTAETNKSAGFYKSDAKLDVELDPSKEERCKNSILNSYLNVNRSPDMSTTTTTKISPVKELSPVIANELEPPVIKHHSCGEKSPNQTAVSKKPGKTNLSSNSSQTSILNDVYEFDEAESSCSQTNKTIERRPPLIARLSNEKQHDKTLSDDSESNKAGKEEKTDVKNKNTDFLKDDYLPESVILAGYLSSSSQPSSKVGISPAGNGEEGKVESEIDETEGYIFKCDEKPDGGYVMIAQKAHGGSCISAYEIDSLKSIDENLLRISDNIANDTTKTDDIKVMIVDNIGTRDDDKLFASGKIKRASSDNPIHHQLNLATTKNNEKLNTISVGLEIAKKTLSSVVVSSCIIKKPVLGQESLDLETSEVVKRVALDNLKQKLVTKIQSDRLSPSSLSYSSPPSSQSISPVSSRSPSPVRRHDDDESEERVEFFAKDKEHKLGCSDEQEKYIQASVKITDDPQGCSIDEPNRNVLVTSSIDTVCCKTGTSTISEDGASEKRDYNSESEDEADESAEDQNGGGGDCNDDDDEDDDSETEEKDFTNDDSPSSAAVVVAAAAASNSSGDSTTDTDSDSGGDQYQKFNLKIQHSYSKGNCTQGNNNSPIDDRAKPLDVNKNHQPDTDEELSVKNTDELSDTKPTIDEDADGDVESALLCQESLPGSPVADESDFNLMEREVSKMFETPFGSTRHYKVSHYSRTAENTPPSTPEGSCSPLHNISCKDYTSSPIFSAGAKSRHRTAYMEEDWVEGNNGSSESKKYSSKKNLYEYLKMKRNSGTGGCLMFRNADDNNRPVPNESDSNRSPFDNSEENSRCGLSPDILSSRSPTTLSAEVPYYSELDAGWDADQRIAFWESKLQELRSAYMSLKRKVAKIDKKRKKLRRKKRERQRRARLMEKGDGNANVSGADGEDDGDIASNLDDHAIANSNNSASTGKNDEGRKRDDSAVENDVIDIIKKKKNDDNFLTPSGSIAASACNNEGNSSNKNQIDDSMRDSSRTGDDANNYCQDSVKNIDINSSGTIYNKIAD